MMSNKKKSKQKKKRTNKRPNVNPTSSRSGPRSTKKLNSIPISRGNLDLYRTYNGRNQSMRLASSICSKLNPFCPESIGSKISDVSANFTIPFTSRYIVTVNSLADGSFGNYFNPMLENAYGISTTTAGGFVTVWTFTNSPDIAGAGTFEEYRVVSWGARVLTTMPWTTAQGTCIASQINTQPVNGVISTSSMNNGQSTSLYELRDLDITFIGKPSDNTFADFVAIASPGGITDLSAPPYTSLLITGTGTPATSPLGVAQVCVNYEFRSKSGANVVANQFGSVPAKPNTALMELVAQTRNNLPTFFEKSKNFDNDVMSYAMKSLRAAAPSLLSQAFTGLTMLL